MTERWTSIPDRTEKIKERLQWQTKDEERTETNYIWLREHWVGDEGDQRLVSKLLEILRKRNERLGIEPWNKDWKPSLYMRFKKWMST